MATIIIKDCGNQSLSESQLKVLLAFVQQDMENANNYNSMFALCKAVLSRRVLMPEIYDMMDRVAEIMVQSSQSAAREQCRQVCACCQGLA